MRSVYVFIFFIYCTGHHRHLHSFPTRRSSDLEKALIVLEAVRRPDDRVVQAVRMVILEHLADALFEVRRCDELQTARSEEHTSELQSQSNLVCRLLLEKKKKQHRKR